MWKKVRCSGGNKISRIVLIRVEGAVIKYYDGIIDCCKNIFFTYSK